MVDLKILANLVIEGEEAKVKELVQQAIAEGVPPGRVLNDGLISGMNVVGERMRNHEMYLPEVMLSAMTMQAGMDVLQGSLGKDTLDLGAKVVLGTVKGDTHDIGKNIVRQMLIGAGFEVIDLGTDIAPEKFVCAVQEEKAKVLAMSALLTTTMAEMRNTIEALEKAGLREKIKVIVGGAPVNSEYAKQIGADGYAMDAARAVDKVRALVGS